MLQGEVDAETTRIVSTSTKDTVERVCCKQPVNLCELYDDLGAAGSEDTVIENNNETCIS